MRNEIKREEEGEGERRDKDMLFVGVWLMLQQEMLYQIYISFQHQTN